jgi:hypothetical protein
MHRTVTFTALILGCWAITAGCRENHTDSQLNAQNPTAGGPREAVDSAAAASLKQEITAVRSEIADAEAESSKYSGGLVKALVESRSQTLKQTLAMLEQRDRAWTFGLHLRYTMDGKPFVLPSGAKEQLPEVERELQNVRARVEAQRQEVGKYSGGLVYALALSTLETMKQTEAMVDQRRLAIKYELPQYLAFQQPASVPSTASVAPGVVPGAPPATVSTGEDWEIVAIASRPGESNSSWTRFAWKLILRNRSATTQKLDATIEFRDADGFPVDSAQAYDLVVRPSGEETFTGEKLITASEVSRIRSTVAKVKKSS